MIFKKGHSDEFEATRNGAGFLVKVPNEKEIYLSDDMIKELIFFGLIEDQKSYDHHSTQSI